MSGTAPTITSNGGGAAAGITFDEGLLSVTTVTGADLEGDTLTYSIFGGADATKFSINSTTGALSFKSGRTSKRRQTWGANNTYEVTVRVYDGTSYASQTHHGDRCQRRSGHGGWHDRR